MTESMKPIIPKVLATAVLGTVALTVGATAVFAFEKQ